ncbi:MFS domain-containing protein [Nephila pilipes]|uniref:MFS domain-containing protein n=1 Tax=Nephila pilipes TaxID=299642 RepID=A0A8X6JG64_NEPPI|nr:MFS domain-containing protein [Nephila pilipes]
MTILFKLQVRIYIETMRTYTADSCYSWIIAVACHVIHFFLYGIFRIEGLLFVEVMSDYNLNREQASIPFIIGSTFKCLVGPLAGYLANTLGFRPVIAFGCILASIGIGTCYFSPNIQLICFLWGILFGLGCSMATSMLPQVINLHFKKHASKANGLSLAGISVAGFILSPIVTALLDTYGLSGTYLVLSAIILNSLPASLLIRVPSDDYSTDVLNDTEICTMLSIEETVTRDNNLEVLNTNNCLKSSDSTDSKDCNGIVQNISNNSCNQQPQNSHGLLHEYTNKETATGDKDLISGSEEILTMNRSEVLTSKVKLQEISEKMSSIDVIELQKFPLSNSEKNKIINSSGETNGNVRVVYLPVDREHKSTSSKRSFAAKKLKSCVQSFGIFFDPIFLFISIARCITIFFLLVIPTVIIDFSRDKNLSGSESLYLLMSFSGFDLAGKIGLGWITDAGYITMSKYTAISFCVMAASLAFMTWSNGFAMILIGVAGVSVCSGTLAPAFPVLVRQFMEKEKQTMAISSSLVLMVPLSFLTTPLIGYFRDGLGSYSGLFYCMSVVCVLCGALILLLPCISRRMHKNLA